MCKVAKLDIRKVNKEVFKFVNEYSMIKVNGGLYKHENLNGSKYKRHIVKFVKSQKMTFER